MSLINRVGIFAPKRTPIGKIAGMLAGIDAWDLQARTFKATLEAVPDDLRNLDEVIVGNVTNSIGNIARIAATGAGIDPAVPAYTVDRQCASSMEALAIAAAKINAGLGACYLVGGTESASRAPWLYEKTERPYSYMAPQPYKLRFAGPDIEDPPMGETAEILADEFSIAREDMDAYAASSHQRTAAAADSGKLKDEIIPIVIPQRKGDPLRLDRDECVRPDTTAEVLAKLRPVFRKDGRVTAGNSSPMNDGAVSAIAVSEDTIRNAGLQPDAWLTDVHAVALEPRRMGMGPSIAVQQILKRNNLTDADIDLYEINEAFAAQVLAVNKELKIPQDKLNIHGGAIAIGHPLGVSGLRIVGTLINALKVTGGKRGVAALCVGGGQGMACIVEMA